MTSAFDMSSDSTDSSSSSDSSLLTYTCATDLKFSPDPDQTKTRPKPEKSFGSTWTFTSTLWFDLNLQTEPTNRTIPVLGLVFGLVLVWSETGENVKSLAQV